MKQRILTALGALLLSACASTHPGNEGTPYGKEVTGLPVKISAQTVEKPEGEAFQLVEVTLENTSETWFRVNRSEVVINDLATSKVSVVMGQDLVDWAEAMNMRLQKDKQNRQVIQLAMLGAGAVAAGAGSGDSGAGAVGSAMLVGTYAWAMSDVIRHSVRSAEHAEKVPSNHIYRSFSVPGKMFLRRWVLLNKPVNTTVSKLVLEIETVEGQKGTYEIKL